MYDIQVDNFQRYTVYSERRKLEKFYVHIFGVLMVCYYVDLAVTKKT